MKIQGHEYIKISNTLKNGVIIPCRYWIRTLYTKKEYEKMSEKEKRNVYPISEHDMKWAYQFK